MSKFGSIKIYQAKKVILKWTSGKLEKDAIEEKKVVIDGHYDYLPSSTHLGRTRRTLLTEGEDIYD